MIGSGIPISQSNAPFPKPMSSSIANRMTHDHLGTFLTKRAVRKSANAKKGPGHLAIGQDLDAFECLAPACF